MTTLDDVRVLARQLTTREQAQLISDLAQHSADERDQSPGDGRALVAALQQVGPWQGDDLDDLRDLVDATRSQATG